MVITTFYFSGTGNTKWAVGTLHQSLLAKGQQSAVCSIESHCEDVQKVIRESDIVGFAFPVYGMNVPEVMKQFLRQAGKAFAEDGQKPVFIAVTGGYADGCGPYEAVGHLAAKNAVLKGYVFLKIANNAGTSGKSRAPIPADKMRTRLANCSRKLDALADALTAGKTKIEPGVYRGVLFRGMMNKLVRGAYSHMSVDPTTCSRCMTCVENCPTKSIEVVDGAFVFRPTCTACLRCFNFCPTYSIWYGGRYIDPDVSPRYLGPGA